MSARLIPQNHPLYARLDQALSNIDRAILRLLADGLTFYQVGRHLGGLSETAVKDRCKRARRQVDARNTTHLVALAVRAGLI